MIQEEGVLMDCFKNLPVEIKVEILTRLPTELVMDCKLVCTNWNHLISRHPLFAKMHLHRLNHPSDSASAADSGKLGFLASTAGQKLHYFEYNDTENHEKPIQRITRISFTPPFKRFRFVGSCNGLICLAGGREYVCICNPITKECVMLPEIKEDWIKDNGLDFHWVNGFCYVSSTNEYKVLRIYVVSKPWKAQIYTLGSGNGWRDLGDFNSTICIAHANDAGILANGALYWMDDELKMIGVFDFVEEKFSQHLSPPPLLPGTDWFNCDIGVLNGFLYFAASKRGVEGCKYWLLTAKNDIHGMKGRDEHELLGWGEEFKVGKRGQLLAITKSGSVLTCIDNYFNSYDTKDSTSKRLVDFKEQIRRVIPHMNTLVSLKELGEEDAKTLESVDTEETKAVISLSSSYRRMRCEP